MSDGKNEVLEGVKLTPEEVAKLDPAKMGVGTSVPPATSEVEGQAWVWRTVRCPHCFSLRYIRYDTVHYHWYTCGNCGLPYKV